MLDDLRLDVVQLAVNLQSLLASSFGTVLCWAKRTEFERPFTSHMSSGMDFLQLNWLWVPLIVTRPITEPCIIAAPYQGALNVHVEQNVECTSHFLIPFLIWAAKLLSFGISIAMQNVAVCGIREGPRD